MSAPDPGHPDWQGTAELVAGRECGTCTMCCKVMGIKEIAEIAVGLLKFWLKRAI